MHIQGLFNTALDAVSVPPDEAARAYDTAGSDYLHYADGEAAGLFDFSGCYGFADRQMWSRLDAVLRRMAEEGHRRIRILDVGCGPGTWLQRLIVRAGELGFRHVDVRGFDISSAMVDLARAATRSAAASLPAGRVTVSIEVADACGRFPEADGSVDLCICLYGVLNHLPREALSGVAAELARVTGGSLFVTVRAAGSLPTIYVDSLDQARTFHQDHRTDRMDVVLRDGRRLCFRSHLFRGEDLRTLFAPHYAAVTVAGLDLFHSRFATDPRWNPADMAAESLFNDRLARLEEAYAETTDFVDRAAHIVLAADGIHRVG